MTPQSDDSAGAELPPAEPTVRGGPTDHDAEVDDVALWLGEQLDRRRAAALRLPPLADGRRDPLRRAPADGGT